MTENLDMNGGAQGRPTFLTVLCILTFIGSGLGIIGGLMGLMGSAALSMFAVQGTMLVQILALAACAMCLFGAIKMWGLAKQGFMIYALGALLSIVSSIVSALTIGSMMQETMSTISSLEGADAELGNALGGTMAAAATAAAWTGVVLSVIINGLFILLYNMNKKHLVN